jgi:Ca-activated chloride channel family protein
MVWTGQTLRELQQHVSTPMLSALRGVWKTLEALEPTDRLSVLAFADQSGIIYEDSGSADRPARLAAAKMALGRLGSGVDESGLGRGTRLLGALQHALARLPEQPEGEEAAAVRRLILVSDGVIEDAEACRPLLERALERGLVISVIGVGDDFDEEFLMAVADLTRGDYYYAPTAPEVEQAVHAERAIVATAVGRQGTLYVRPEGGTILHDVYPVAPSLSEFQMMWVENGGWRFRIGDLSAARTLEFLLELAPAAFPAGEMPLATVRLDALAPDSQNPVRAETSVRLFYSDEPMLLQARDDEVLDTVFRLDIYREERRAAVAAAQGNQEQATKHLRAATRMLRRIGADSLAEDMDAAASETEAGKRDETRTKRVKAGTRRLGQERAGQTGAGKAPGGSSGTRQLR